MGELTTLEPVIHGLPIEEGEPVYFTLEDAIIQTEEHLALPVPKSPYVARHAQRTEKRSWSDYLRTSRVGKAIIGLATTAGLAGGGIVLSASPASADATHVYTVSGTGSDGVWLHNEPGIHTGLIKVMPENTEFTADCYEVSDPVGERDNPIWLHGTDTGYFTDYFSSSRWDSNNTLKDQGLPECGNQPVKDSQTTQQDTPKSVFYSPLSPPGGLNGLYPADINLPIKSWSSGDCTPELAANIPEGVHTLAGWSVGRLGPIYFLRSANANQVGNVHRIILFDPGASSDMDAPNLASQLKHHAQGEDVVIPCDTNYDINGLLSGWVSSNDKNRLFIITGKDTEMKTNPGDPSSNSTYKALWKNYLAGLWNQNFAKQVKVCDYNNMDHEAILKNFNGLVNSAQSNCPADPTGQHKLTTWHP